MVPGVSPLRVSLAAAQDLFRTQIADGEHLLQRVAVASAAADLAQVGDALSAWSARNEAVYVRVIGANAGREYLVGINEAVDAVRGSGQKRSWMIRCADAGLRMLRRTAAVLDLVPDGVPAAVPPSAARRGAGAGRVADIPVPAVAGSWYHLSEPVRRPEDGTITSAAQRPEGPGSGRASGSEAPAAARRPDEPGARPGPRGKPGGHRGQRRRAARGRGQRITITIIIIAAVIGTILAVVLTTG